MYEQEEALTRAVLKGLQSGSDERFERLMTALVHHLHAFVREVEMTEAEWFDAIGFLTATGHRCSDLRQEFILLSDTLGVSMLVDAVNHRLPNGATETTVFGPFHRQGAPRAPMWGDIAAGTPGEPLYLWGRVLDVQGQPLAGAEVEIWHADGRDGLYDVQRPGTPVMGRGVLNTDAQGRWAVRSIKPTHYPIPSDGPVGVMLRRLGRHPYRPAHVHAMVSAPGHTKLVTHLFVAGDPYIDSDAVFGVKDSLVVQLERFEPGTAPDGQPCPTPYYTLQYDFKLAKG